MTVAINSIKRMAERKELFDACIEAGSEEDDSFSHLILESAEEQRRGLGIREGLDPEIPRSHGRRNDQSVTVALDRGALRSYQRPGSTGFGI